MAPDISFSWTLARIFHKIMGPIWMNSGTYGYFFTLIPMAQKFLKFSPSLRYFSHLKDWGQFYRFNSTSNVLRAENHYIGIIYHAESHGKKSFSKFGNFTLSRSKVWNLPFGLNLGSLSKLHQRTGSRTGLDQVTSGRTKLVRKYNGPRTVQVNFGPKYRIRARTK